MVAKVIAGEVFGVKGPIEAKTPTYFIDFKLQAGKEYEHPIPKNWNAMVIVHNGGFEVQGKKQINKGDCAVFSVSASGE